MRRYALFTAMLISSCAGGRGARGADTLSNTHGTLFLVFEIERATAPLLTSNRDFYARFLRNIQLAFSNTPDTEHEIAGVRSGVTQLLGTHQISVGIARQTL